jgi:hypothetical protein
MSRYQFRNDLTVDHNRISALLVLSFMFLNKPHPACVMCFVLTLPKRWRVRHLIDLVSFCC